MQTQFRIVSHEPSWGLIFSKKIENLFLLLSYHYAVMT